MKTITSTLGLLALASAVLQAADAPATNTARRTPASVVRFPKTEVKYTHGPDSLRKEGVPRGKVTDFDWTNSAVFPNTIRHCSIYVPAQYDAAKPAALMIFQDGHTYQKEDGDFRAPDVQDQIHFANGPARRWENRRACGKATG